MNGENHRGKTPLGEFKVTMSRLAPMCMILSSLGGPKAFLVPQSFVLPMCAHSLAWEKASSNIRMRNMILFTLAGSALGTPPDDFISTHIGAGRPHTHQGRAPLTNQALDAHLSDVGLLAFCLTHTFRRESSSTLIPSVMPPPLCAWYCPLWAAWSLS